MLVAPRVLPLRHPHRLLVVSHTSSAPTCRFFTSPRPLPRRRIRCPCARGGGRPAWGSNAESVPRGRSRFRDARGEGGGGGSSGGDAVGAQEETEEGEGWWGRRRRERRRWWSDNPFEDEWDVEDDEGFDLLDDELEQPWEKFWMFKVFKSYGYFLPAIIASMLLATGPKAFLMALALPLGQSALSLAIDKFWGDASKVTRSKSKSKSKKRPFGRSAGNFRREEEVEIDKVYQGREAYRSWMATDAVASDREGESPAFGGWDELEGRREYAEGPKQQPSKTTSSNSSRAQTIKKGKLSRRERKKEMPLFLRLLIAVFPFLGSWTRIL